jgi:hypothetical protein
VFVHVASGLIFVNSSFTAGCNHHIPFFAYKTICCPGRAPLTRPSMMSSVSE